MRGFAARAGAVAACGFGLSKAATSIGYLSAMGSVTRSVGFVTELWFMLASEAVSVVLAVAVGALAAQGRLRPRSISQWQALLVFFAGFLLSSSGALSGLPESAAAGLLGLTYGASSFLFCVTWLEEFAYREPRESHACMAAGLCIQMAVVAAASLAPSFLLTPFALGSALVSVLCHFEGDARRIPRLLHAGAAGAPACPPSACEVFEPVTARAFVARFGTPFSCLFVLVGVVGILHTSVLGSSFEHIVGDVSMWVPLTAATLVAVAVSSAALRLPDPIAVYKAVLPVMLVLLSLLPFVGDLLGPLAGGVMIACYDVCGMLFLFFIVDVAYRHRQQSYLLSSVYMGGSNGFLALGLGIGVMLNSLSGDHGISLLTLLAFAAIYPLGIAFVVAMRRGMRTPPRSSGPLAREAVANAPGHGAPDGSSFVAGAACADSSASPSETRAPSAGAGPGAEAACVHDAGERPAADPQARSAASEPDWEAALRAFAARYRLTRRETDICSYLVRGRSAKHIAEELFISENTVWTHTKNVYAKTKVSGKDDLMNLFEHEASSDA